MERHTPLSLTLLHLFTGAYLLWLLLVNLKKRERNCQNKAVTMFWSVFVVICFLNKYLNQSQQDYVCFHVLCIHRGLLTKDKCCRRDYSSSMRERGLLSYVLLLLIWKNAYRKIYDKLLSLQLNQLLCLAHVEQMQSTIFKLSYLVQVLRQSYCLRKHSVFRVIFLPRHDGCNPVLRKI